MGSHRGRNIVSIDVPSWRLSILPCDFHCYHVVNQNFTCPPVMLHLCLQTGWALYSKGWQSRGCWQRRSARSVRSGAHLAARALYLRCGFLWKIGKRPSRHASGHACARARSRGTTCDSNCHARRASHAIFVEIFDFFLGSPITCSVAGSATQRQTPNTRNYATTGSSCARPPPTLSFALPINRPAASFKEHDARNF